MHSPCAYLRAVPMHSWGMMKSEAISVMQKQGGVRIRIIYGGAVINGAIAPIPLTVGSVDHSHRAAEGVGHDARDVAEQRGLAHPRRPDKQQ